MYGTFRMFIPLKLFVTLLDLTTGWDKSEPYTPGGRPPTGPWLVGVIWVPKGVVDRAVRPDRWGFKPAVNGAFRPEMPAGPRASSLPAAIVVSAKVPNPVNALTQTRHLKDFMLSSPSISALSGPVDFLPTTSAFRYARTVPRASREFRGVATKLGKRLSPKADQ